MAAEWASFRLGPACSKVGSGATPRGGGSVYLPSGDVALIRSQNVYNDGFHHDGLVYLTKEHADQLGNVVVEPGDVLLNITGDSVARCCQVDRDVLPARVNQHVAIIRPDPTVLDARYLRYFLVSPGMQGHLLSLAGAGATRNALTKGMIESFEILAPRDVVAQRAIAAVLGALDDRIEINRKTARVLEGIARRLFQSWFVDFDPIRRRAVGGEPIGLPPDAAALYPKRLVNSPIGEVPEGWRAAKLGEVIEIHDSKRIPMSSRERAERQGPYRYYGAAGIVDYVDAFLFDGTYLLLGEDGSVVDDDGHPIVQYVWGKFWVNNHAHVLTGASGLCVEHLYLLAQGLNVKPFVTGAVQPKISQGNLKAIPVVLAPEAVNIAFGRTIAPLFARLKVAFDQSTTLASIRDALLPKLISGELRIADAEKIIGRVGV